ncbi:MAG: T9SS type A sorting domain-containing protein, partial [Balneolales bacterium]|nr:T9SS type A sorting domain-containing protein [Balneolales bacterium]
RADIGTYGEFRIPDAPGDSIVFRIQDKDSPDIFTDTEAFEIVSLVSNEIEENPLEFRLFQNYPNPFNPSTNISFELKEASHITVSVHDVTGKTISTLVDDFKNSGTHNVYFEASNLASGVYFYRLETPEFSRVQKMTLLK